MTQVSLKKLSATTLTRFHCALINMLHWPLLFILACCWAKDNITETIDWSFFIRKDQCIDIAIPLDNLGRSSDAPRL